MRSTDTFIKNAPKDEVNAALVAGVLREATSVPIPFTPIVGQTGGKLVVFDTGTGRPVRADQGRGRSVPRTTCRPPASTGAQVDTMIISHFHGDHINGLMATGHQAPTFPNAEIMVPAAEWKYWTDDGDMSKAARGAADGSSSNVQARVRRAWQEGDAVRRRTRRSCRASRSVATLGHTPGHTSLSSYASGRQQADGAGDVTQRSRACSCATRAGSACSTWTAPLAEATGARLYDMASSPTGC